MSPPGQYGGITTELSSDDESQNQNMRARRYPSSDEQSNQQRKRARLDDSDTPSVAQANHGGLESLYPGSHRLSQDPNVEAMASGLAMLQQAQAGDLLNQMLAAQGLAQMSPFQGQLNLPSNNVPALFNQQPRNSENVAARGPRMEDFAQQALTASALAQLQHVINCNSLAPGSTLSQPSRDEFSSRANPMTSFQDLAARLNTIGSPRAASAPLDATHLSLQGFPGSQQNTTVSGASLPSNLRLPPNDQQASAFNLLLGMLGGNGYPQHQNQFNFSQNQFQNALGLEMLAQTLLTNHAFPASNSGVQQEALARPQTTASIIDSEAFKNRDANGVPYDLPARLALPDDHLKLSIHQTFLRLQIEAFRATSEDVSTHTRGRNKPVVLGQVGIRCRHCAHIAVRNKQKGSAYFPAAMTGIYQAAQNMSTTHLQCGLCSEMPNEMKQNFADLLSTKSVSSGAGRPYWAQAARKLGLVDTENGIRFIRDLPSRSLEESGGKPATIAG